MAKVAPAALRGGASSAGRRLLFLPLRTIWRVRHFPPKQHRKGSYAVLTRCPACNNETRLAFHIPWLAAFYLCPSCNHAHADATARDPGAEQGHTAERLSRVVVYA